jgi:hypothetical protein
MTNCPLPDHLLHSNHKRKKTKKKPPTSSKKEGIMLFKKAVLCGYQNWHHSPDRFFEFSNNQIWRFFNSGYLVPLKNSHYVFEKQLLGGINK